MILFPCLLCADSLWRDDEGGIYGKKKYDIGDIITVIVVESAEATHEERTDNKKSAGLNGGPDEGTKNLLSFIPFLGGSANTDFSGSGTTKRSGLFETSISVEIINVFPNGNLEIQGEKKVRINSEEQEIKVSGIVRPEDIDVDNSVKSTFVSNANISYKGNLKISDEEKEGILTQILSTVLGFLF